MKLEFNFLDAVNQFNFGCSLNCFLVSYSLSELCAIFYCYLLFNQLYTSLGKWKAAARCIRTP